MSKTIPSNPAKITLKNIKKYIQGYIRSFVFKFRHKKYISKFAEDLKVLQPHQIEQYKWRLTVMNPKCLEEGKCVVCGCETPYLQMSSEACDGNCYPEFKSKKEWDLFKKENKITI